MNLLPSGSRPQHILYLDGRGYDESTHEVVGVAKVGSPSKREIKVSVGGWFLDTSGVTDLQKGDHFTVLRKVPEGPRSDGVLVERINAREGEYSEPSSSREFLIDSTGIGIGSTILGKILYRVKTTSYEGTYSGWNSQPDQKGDQNVQFWIGNTTAQKIRVLSLEGAKLRVQNLDDEESSSINEGQKTMNGSVYTASVVRSKTVAAGVGVTTGVVVSEVIYTKSSFVALNDNAARAIALAEAMADAAVKADPNDPTQPIEVKLVKAGGGGEGY